MWIRAKEGHPAPIDGETEAHDGEAGEDSDKDGKKKEETFFLEIGVHGQVHKLTREAPDAGAGWRRRRSRGGGDW